MLHGFAQACAVVASSSVDSGVVMPISRMTSGGRNGSKAARSGLFCHGTGTWKKIRQKLIQAMFGLVIFPVLFT